MSERRKLPLAALAVAAFAAGCDGTYQLSGVVLDGSGMPLKADLSVAVYEADEQPVWRGGYTAAADGTFEAFAVCKPTSFVWLKTTVDGYRESTLLLERHTTGLRIVMEAAE